MKRNIESSTQLAKRQRVHHNPHTKIEDQDKNKNINHPTIKNETTDKPSNDWSECYIG